MLNVIKSHLNKTPIKNNLNQVKKIESVNVVDNLLQSQFIGEGVYGLELIITKDTIEYYTITPTFENLDGEDSHFLDLEEQYNCYEIYQTLPSFYPLKQITFLPDIQKHISDETVFVQILFSKRLDNWKDKAIDQYVSYLKGNDLPSKNRRVRNLQEKVLRTLDNIVDKHINRERVSQIEDKIAEDGYRTEIRLIVKDSNEIENDIRKLLDKMEYFNSLYMYKVKNVRKFVMNAMNREFTKKYEEQMLSESELKSLLTGQINAKITPVKEVKHENIDNNLLLNDVLSILPVGEQKEREIDSEISDKIKNAFKRVKLVKNQKVNVLNVQQGSTLQKITVKIPDQINYSDIEKQVKNLKATLGVESLSIEQGDEPETVSLLIPVSEREIVYLKKLLEDEEFIKYADEHILPFISGVDVLGKPLYTDLAALPHLLVAGTTGSGKSVFINVLILILLIMRKPTELMMYLIDPKKVELSQYNGFPHVKDVVTDMTKAHKLLKSLVVEMDKRYEKLAEAGYKKVSAYNQSNENKIPYIVCVIDEFADLIMTAPNDIEDLVVRLAQKARGAGIHLVIATQKPLATVITSLIKDNMPSKISFNLNNSNGYRTVFGTGQPYHLLGRGDGVMRLEGQIKEFERFQSSIITLNGDEEQDIFDQIKGLYDGDKVEGIEIVEEVIIEPIDKLKQIIANTEETRISKLREMMGIRINDVKELMQQLVEEEWLEAPQSKNKGYQLIASEEILNEWRDTP